MRKNLNQQLENAFLDIDAERVKSLLEKGADKNRHIRNSLLPYVGGKIDVYGLPALELLYNNGANLNAKDWEGKTVLMKMAGFSNCIDTELFETTDWLIKPIYFVVSHGAKVNLRDKSGKDAMMHSLSQRWGIWDNYVINEYDDPGEYDDEYESNFSNLFYHDIPAILFANGARLTNKVWDCAKELENLKGEKFTSFAFSTLYRQH